MGFSRAVDDDRTLINLSSFQLPNKAVNQAPMLTPPPKSYVSVPFQWEEAPGKPRLTTAATPVESVKTKSARRVLDLPPCRLLINEADASPTTVLDGPYLGRGGRGRWSSFRKSPSEKYSSGSARWGSFRKSSSTHLDSFSSHPKPPKVKIMRRRPSFFSFSESSTRPHLLWGSIYESLKQVVPWRRRH